MQVFVALARALTRRKLEVAPPDLPSLRRFRIDGEAPNRIADIAREAERPSLLRVLPPLLRLIAAFLNTADG